MLKFTSLTVSIVLAAAASATGQSVTTIDGHQYAESQFVPETAHIPFCATDHHHAANGISVVDINGLNPILDLGGCAYGLLTFMSLAGATGSTPTNFSAVQPVDLFLAGLGLFTEEAVDAQSREYGRLLREQGRKRTAAPFYTPEAWGPIFVHTPHSITLYFVHTSSGGRMSMYKDEEMFDRVSVLQTLSKTLSGSSGDLSRLLDAANNNMGQGQSLEDAIESAVIHYPGDASHLNTDEKTNAALIEVQWQAQEDLVIARTPRRAARAGLKLRALTALRSTLASPGATEAVADLDAIDREAARLEKQGDKQLAKDPTKSKLTFKSATKKRKEAGDGYKRKAVKKFKEASDWEDAAGREEDNAAKNEQKARDLDKEADRLEDEAKGLRGETKKDMCQEADDKRQGAEDARKDAKANRFFAEGHRERAAELMNEAAEAWEVSSNEYQNAAENAEKAGNKKEAAELWEKAGNTIAPDSLKPWLIELRTTPEEFEKAARQAEKAAKRFKKAADLQEERGDKDEARRLRKRAERQKKSAAKNYRSAADAHEKKGDNNKAREAREKADKLDPSGGGSKP